MICHPFDYKEYSRPKCIVHRICLGCLFGCILGCDNLAKIFINLKRVWESQDVDVSYQLIENFEFAMDLVDYANIAKIVAFRSFYCAAIIKIAIMVKKSLAESERISACHTSYRSFWGLSVIPFLSISEHF